MPRLFLLLAMGLSTGLADGKQVPTFASASLVLGQQDFTSATVPPAPTAASLDSPSAVVVDAATGKVFVTDTGNNRVLRYASATALQNGAAAEAAFGQSDRTSNGAPPAAADSLDSPNGLWIDTGGRLWVADTDNNRVVMYANAATAGDGPDAALVLGQPDPTSESAVTSQAGMSAPQGLCMDPGGRLWVADKGNNRVLRFDNAASNTTGGASAAADGEFGQDQAAPFTTSTGDSDNLHFIGPTGVAVDSNGTLWVSDRGNNRIMGFPSAATISNGANGARILGQPDYNAGSTNPGLSSSGISGPTGLFIDAAGSLWVLDQGNNRALRFANIKSIDNGKPAASVVGQVNFTSNSAGLDARRLDTTDAGDSPGLFVQPDGTLWLSDLNNNRVLRYATADSGAPAIQIAGKRKITTTRPRFVVRGTASDDTAVASVTIQQGRKKKTAAGTSSWKKSVKLLPGRNVVKAFATDTAGKVSPTAKVVLIRKAAP